MADGTLWQTLVAAALIGTDRQTPPELVDSSAIGQFLTQLPPAPQEVALLQQAAALTLYGKAGQKPTQLNAPAPIACDLADLPPAPPSTLSYLHQTIRGDRPAFLPECLSLVARAGWRIPDRLLPALLDRGAKQSELQPVILPVLGQRGRWLAQQQEIWNYAIVTSENGLLDDTIWDTGKRAQRIQYLQQLRQQDSEQARMLLESSIAQESAKDRAAFLKILQIDLSDADLPLLEQCLRDRSQEVQQVAIGLLTQLPQSTLCQLAISVLQGAIDLPGLATGQVEVNLPKNLEATLKPFKVAKISPLSTDLKLGKTAMELAQIISWVPLASWPEQFKITLSDLLEQTTHSPWRNAIVTGLVHAAVNQCHAIVAAELLRYLPEADSLLFPLLSAEQANQLLQYCYAQGEQERLGRLVQDSTQPWNAAVTEIAIAMIAEKLQSKSQLWTIFYWLNDKLVTQFDLTQITVIKSLKALRSEDHYTQQQLEKIYELVRFRQDMVQALQPESG
ncbi:DUF5691 domain-containing protein [Alkalinema pantanalense CENA528]|uniref:DUF5691 domain-containing protein n=1 Tax=Alkalinema pantanalense TaxID=1620705 RepID=UPI003D6E4459